MDKKPGWLARASAAFKGEAISVKETPEIATGGTAPRTTSLIPFKDIPNEAPAFRREYTARLSNGRTVKIDARTSYGGGRSLYGEITQPNGRWVLFDPERIADKILDRELLPQIERVCRAIIAQDRSYMASRPSSFVDERGVRWVRA